MQNWKYNQDKAFGILTREYGISPKEALTEYTEDQVQSLLAQLPVDRVINIGQGMSEIEIKNRYLNAYMDRDIKAVSNAHEIAELKDQRANLKAQLRKDKDNQDLKNRLEEITKQINKE